MTTHTTLPLNQLRIDDKANVRKIGRGAEADFIASIKAIGIQMPLIVRKNGQVYVIADGGKRFEAAQALVKKGDLAPDTKVPVIVSDATDAEARELSLALNLIRADMHPVDAYRAFTALHTDTEKPLDVDAIANRFGIEAKTVHQRLALGALSDVILTAWQKGEITADVAKAFTLCPDKAQQVKLYAKLKKESYNGKVSDWNVKSALKAANNEGASYLNAVGIDAYEARGGKVTRDLFGSNHVISDEALLTTMAEEKIAETCQKLIADGWKWAIPTPERTYEYGRLESNAKPTPDEKKRLDAINKRLNKLSDDDDEDVYGEEYERLETEKEAIGAEISKRAFSAKQKAEAGCFVHISNGQVVIHYGRTEPKQVKIETSTNPKTGKTESKAVKAKKKGPATLSKSLVEDLDVWRHKALRASLTEHPHANPVSRLLGQIAAAQITDSKSNWHWAPEAIQKQEKELLTLLDQKVVNAALREAFNASDYFNRCGKAFCLSAITEALNADEARKVAGKKKGEIAKFAITNVGKTKWLPKELRAPGYDGPAGKTATKPAAKKKAAKR